ncbi:DNA-directed RNA polymerase, subunit 2 [Kipferlia bialata]|uniref:DNA-directed RNA polymerase n=1 Tax=Kipferlia bialata TaxID=797122 RepID=A0A9K3GLB1_9EUKA|nr:DNA-directed RNA polymerase, subunit 2 [Kipferlia bialata]|eukprot:g9168.t1
MDPEAGDHISWDLDESDMWSVLDAWFSSKGLVSQQVESYNRFVDQTLRDVVELSPPLRIEHETTQNGRFKRSVHEMRFLRHGEHQAAGVTLAMGKPSGEETQPPRPIECRLRGLTYSLSVSAMLRYDPPEGSGQEGREETVLLGHIPLMVRSRHCVLDSDEVERMSEGGSDINKRNIRRIMQGECPYDDGGYFIVKGNEKAVVAQESMRRNHVFVFAMHDDPKYSHRLEIR